MANNFIYLLIIVLTYSRSTEAYFLSEDFDTSLPERYSDPIDENWQDKRSAENQYSNDNKETSVDFDYRNGNVEVDAGKSETFQKRENNEMNTNEHEPFNEADIRQILSQFSTSDRKAFDSLMNDQSPQIDVGKRQLLKQNFENNFHLNKRNNFKSHCKGLNCEEYDPFSVDKELNSEEDGYHDCPEKIDAKRKLKFKRSSSFRSTPRENILQAKISILKDNYKRSSEMRLLEDSAKRRYTKRKRKQDNDRRSS